MNINLHPKSSYTWEEFLESQYFEAVIEEIRFLLKESLTNYFFEFFLFKVGFAEKIICSNDDTNKKILFLLCDEVNFIKEADVIGYDQVFKSYLPSMNSGFIPIPVGFNTNIPLLPIKNIEERWVNIFFSGNLNSNRLTGIYKSLHFLRFIPNSLFLFIYKRPRLQNLLKITFPFDLSKRFSNSMIFFTQQFNSGLSPKEYSYYLSESKIVLCPKGFITTETFRMYEGLRQGCIVVTERLPNHEFYVNSPFVELDNWTELSAKLKKINLQDLQKKCLNFYQENLSENATAKYIVNHLI